MFHMCIRIATQHSFRMIFFRSASHVWMCFQNRKYWMNLKNASWMTEFECWENEANICGNMFSRNKFHLNEKYTSHLVTHIQTHTHINSHPPTYVFREYLIQFNFDINMHLFYVNFIFQNFHLISIQVILVKWKFWKFISSFSHLKFSYFHILEYCRLY